MSIDIVHRSLLRPEVQDFICSYTGELADLAFKGSPFDDIPVRLLLQQIDGRRSIEQKLPLWHANRGVLYPPGIHLEQSSSGATATYKSALGGYDRVADLTGGFGADSLYFSKKAKEVIYVEKNEALGAIAKHNFGLLGANNVDVTIGDGLALLEQQSFDLIYLDPSRRHEKKGKVFFLEDCEPDVPAHIDKLLGSAPQILVKTSPMLDLTSGVSSLGNVAQVHIVAVNNDLKEMLFLVKRGHQSPTVVHCVNLKHGKEEHFTFTFGAPCHTHFAPPAQYIFEPNSAIMKSGGYNCLSEQHKLSKLHPNSHLLTGDSLISFPGRVFRVVRQWPYGKKTERELKQIKRAHITCRNFPLSPPELRKRLGIKDGGDLYLFFTTGQDDGKIVLLCEKVSTI